MSLQQSNKQSNKKKKSIPQFCNLLFFNVFHLEPDAPYILQDSKRVVHMLKEEQNLKMSNAKTIERRGIHDLGAEFALLQL